MQSGKYENNMLRTIQSDRQKSEKYGEKFVQFIS